jgi:3-phosphoshikimate 1-carboxyvinyltransferase
MVKILRPSKLAGSILVPASKSHTIRALLIASLAEGKSRIRNPLDSADARSCIEVCRLFGARIEEDTSAEGRHIHVEGTGGNIRVPEGLVDVGNSGTTLYLAAGIAALAGGEITFTGDSQIQARPAGNLLKSLEDLGARVRTERGNGCAPFTIRGPLRGGETVIECPTSQYLSSLLIAAPLAAGTTRITVPLLYERPYVEMTLKWLAEQGISLERQGLERFTVPGGGRYKAFDKLVPGDFSSAAFFLCAAAVTGSTLTLQGLDMTDSQGDKEVVNILASMGCKVEINGTDIKITGGPLQGRDIDMNAIPDALPALAAAACRAEGTTRLLNVPQARLKETDRIAVMAAELTKMGAEIRELPDGLEVRGRGPGRNAPLRGASVDGHGDHRVVMALAVAALGAEGETAIGTAEAAAVTFPEFFALLEKASTGI